MGVDTTIHSPRYESFGLDRYRSHAASAASSRSPTRVGWFARRSLTSARTSSPRSRRNRRCSTARPGGGRRKASNAR